MTGNDRLIRLPLYGTQGLLRLAPAQRPRGHLGQDLERRRDAELRAADRPRRAGGRTAGNRHASSSIGTGVGAAVDDASSTPARWPLRCRPTARASRTTTSGWCWSVSTTGRSGPRPRNPAVEIRMLSMQTTSSACRSRAKTRSCATCWSVRDGRDRRQRAEVLVWHLPQDADGLPAELRGVLGDPERARRAGPRRHASQPLVRRGDRLRHRRVVCLPADPRAAGHGGGRRPRPAAAARTSLAARPAAVRSGRDAHVFTIFSTKGGSGEDDVATNLAVSFARDGKRTLLMDFDLHSGDDALVLGPVAPLDGARPGAVARRPGCREAGRVRHPATAPASTCYRHRRGPTRRSWSPSTGWSRCWRWPASSTTWS